MDEKEPWLKCVGSRGTVYVTTIIGIVLLLILGIILYRKLVTTEFALESCRSSLESV